MNVVYAENTMRTPEDERLLEQANAQLRDVLDRSEDKVKVEWSRAEDGAGRSLFILRLSRWSHEVSLAFTEGDLRDTEKTWKRMMRVWQGMLRQRDEELTLVIQAAGE